MAAATLIGLVASVLVLILIGLALRLLGVLNREDADVLNNVIVYLALPALIFTAIRDSQFSTKILLFPALGWLIIFVCMALAYGIGRLLKLAPATLGAFVITAGLGNTGYLGYPLALAIFGQTHLVKAVFYDVFGTALILMTAGILIAEKFGADSGERGKVLGILTFPPLIAVALGLVLRPVALPGFISQVIGYLAHATVPLIMLSIGLSLKPGHIVDYRAPIAAAGVVKLLLAPLLALALARATGLPSPDGSILVLQASMPAMTLSFVIGQRYKLDTDYIPAVIFATTLMSAVTIPAWQLLAR